MVAVFSPVLWQHRPKQMNSAPILSVSELNRAVKNLLEFEMRDITVKGEISSLSKPSSGHFYFTLKDKTAQLRCVYFRSRHGIGVKTVENGLQMIAKGKLSLYEARGDYQLIIEQLSELGEGDLYRQFEQLKKKLATDGLFDASRKRQIPAYPDTIGIITSSTGAALRDILITLKRRYPLVAIIIYASDVQGKKAAPQLVKCIKTANDDKRCDVLILARGGGSIEDLWAFNDEKLAYAIAESKIAVVTGVGHETDFTIADFVADLRAATPTAAAETITPHIDDLLNRLNDIETRLHHLLVRHLQHKQLLLNHQIEKLASPKRLIDAKWQTLDYHTQHLQRLIAQIVQEKQHKLLVLKNQLNHQSPQRVLKQTKLQLQSIENSLINHMNQLAKSHRQRLETLLATLHAVSPLATLDRGYAIVSHQKNILFSPVQVQIGDQVDIHLAQGHLYGKITAKGD